MQHSFPKTLFGFYIRRAMRGYWPIISIWVILYIIVNGGNEVLFPMFQRWFISLFEVPVPAGMTFIQMAFPAVCTMIGIWLFIDVLEIARSIIVNRWWYSIRNSISVILNDYAHSQSMTFWTARFAGKVDKQIGDITLGFTGLADQFMRIFISILAMSINVGLVMAINEKIAIVLGSVFMFRLVYSVMLIKPMNRAAKTASESQSTLKGKTIDSVTNYSIVKLFAGRKNEQAHLKKPRERVIKDKITAAFFQRLFWGVPMFVWDITFGVVMILCAILFMDGVMKVSDIVFTISVYFSVMGAIATIVNRIPDVIEIFSDAQKSYEELIKPIEIVDVPNAPDLKLTKGAIDIKNVSFRYKRKFVLNNFSLHIRPGEKVGLVGSSGAGKTTLVNLLMRLYDPTKGEICIDGQNIRLVTQDSIRRNIAFIPQEPSMFNRTLKDNIGYGRIDAKFNEVRNAARHAEIDEFIMAADNKYDAMVGDRGIKLSGGQKQRVAIARAFLKNAPILILDEATSALDSETESAIQKSFAELSAGRTTIAVAHRLSTLRNMDRLIIMREGKIAEQGTHAELLKKKNGIYARLWKMQSGGFIE